MIVIKVGGNADISYDHLLDELATLHQEWVLVHGAGDHATRLGERLGHPPRFVTSVSGHVSRRTDRETLEAFTMASSLLGARLVAGLQRRGVDAVGVSGVDGGLLRARRKAAIKIVDAEGRRRVLRGDHTGTVDAVNARLLRALLDGGHRPVVRLPALSHEGAPVNADADRAAAQVAAAMGASALVLLTDVPGLLRDPEDPHTLIPRVAPRDWEAAAAHAQGRFRKKTLAAREALEGGVPRAVVATANRESPVAAALAGEGTVFEGAPAPTEVSP